MRQRVAEILLELGITPDLKGFNYILEAIQAINSKENIAIMEVYKMVGKKIDKTWQTVDRGITNAIRRRVDVNSEAFKKHIGNVAYVNNSIFLYILAMRIKEE